MELRHLRYFLAVASANSFTRAAEELGISQPTLSHQIRQLEEFAGASLFDRLGKKVRLTPAGHDLVIHARDTLRAADAAIQSFSDRAELLGGKLTIASFPSLRPFVVRAISRFVQDYPRIRIVHHELKSYEIHELIQLGDVEIGFGVNTSIPSSLVAKPLYREPLVLAFRSSHPFARLKSIEMKDVGNTPFISFGYERFTQNAINSFFKRNSFLPNVCLDAPSIDVLFDVVCRTDAVALVPQHFVTSRPDLAYYGKLARPPTRSVALLSAARYHVSVASTQFRKVVMTEANAMKKETSAPSS